MNCECWTDPFAFVLQLCSLLYFIPRCGTMRSNYSNCQQKCPRRWPISNFAPIHPTGQVSLSSDRATLALARRTVWMLNSHSECKLLLLGVFRSFDGTLALSCKCCMGACPTHLCRRAAVARLSLWQTGVCVCVCVHP